MVLVCWCVCVCVCVLCWCVWVGVCGPDGRLSAGPPSAGPPKISTCFPLPPPLSFFFSLSLWRSSLTRQPQSEKRAHLRVQADQNTTKIPREDPQREREKKTREDPPEREKKTREDPPEREKKTREDPQRGKTKRKCGRKRKQCAKFWAPHPSGSHKTAPNSDGPNSVAPGRDRWPGKPRHGRTSESCSATGQQVALRRCIEHDRTWSRVRLQVSLCPHRSAHHRDVFAAKSRYGGAAGQFRINCAFLIQLGALNPGQVLENRSPGHADHTHEPMMA